jgi:hypothetical protein
MRGKQIKNFRLYFIVFLVVSLFALSVLPQSKADLSFGLVGYWPFNEGTETTTYDYSGNNHTGSLQNNPSWVIGRYGGAIELNGVNQFSSFTTSSDFTSSDLTVTAWIYPRSISGYQIIAGMSDGGYTINYELRLNSNTLELVVTNGTASTVYLATKTGLISNTWYFVCGVIQNGVLNVYINTVGGTSGSYTGTRSSVTSDFLMGCRTATSLWFNGTIDDLRVYDRALSDSEVSELYYYPYASPSPSPQTNPSATPIASPVFVSSISSSPLWQYLYAYDFAGFVIATWTFSLGQSFFVIVAFIVSLAIYIRYQNLIAVSIIWIVLGSVFVVWIPMVTPFIIFAFAFGFGSLIYKIYESRN